MSVEFPPAERPKMDVEKRHRSWADSAMVWGGAVGVGAAMVGLDALGAHELREFARQIQDPHLVFAVEGSALLVALDGIWDSVRLGATALGFKTKWRRGVEEAYEQSRGE